MDTTTFIRAQEHLTTYGQGELLVLYESESAFNNPQAIQLVDQKLSVAGFYIPRQFRCAVLRTLRDTDKKLSLNRTLFYTKAQGTTQNRPCIHGLYPNQEVEQAYYDLRRLIRSLQPCAILCLGSLPFFLLTGQQSISDYRGSEESFTHEGHKYPVLGTYNPLSVLSQIELQFELGEDIKRLHSNMSTWGQEAYSFAVATSYKQACDLLAFIASRKRITNDIETQARRQITCIGFGYSPSEAIVIPFVSKEYPLGYYSLDQEVDLIQRIHKILTSPAIELCNQNYIYDCQFMARMWGIKPHISHDTYIAQSVLYPGQPRKLAYLSSLYCKHHTYWKNELDDWKTLDAPDSTLFFYNAKDCARTYEVLDTLLDLLNTKGLYNLYERQIHNANLTLKIILRGIRKDFATTTILTTELHNAIRELETFLIQVVPFLPSGIIDSEGKRKGAWWNSTDKLKHLCYEIFKVKPILHKKTRQVTVGKEAIVKIIKDEPILRPILNAVLHIHSFENSLNVVRMGHDPVDNRFHTDLTPCGTKTFRYTSSEDAFGFGSNFQNMTSGEK